ncbi:MAG: hypothetical protein M0Z28_27425 [Rhodospirillales bacterium]|nr:hypothetical protein [Rhodospirillales bacterium]
MVALHTTPREGTPGVALGPISPREHTTYAQRGNNHSAAERGMELAKAQQQLLDAIPASGHLAQFRDFIAGLSMPGEMRRPEFEQVRATQEAAMALPNAVSKAYRENVRHYQTVAPGRQTPLNLADKVREIAKSGAISKATLDVGSQTNFTQITGGQSLGYVSLDTRVARGTVRPDSFTLYQALPKSAAFQIVDYWAYIDDPGGPLPGSAFSGFSTVSTGSLATDAGVYSLSNVDLKLALDGRAVTVALMAQNSFVDVVAQENANAALTVLSSLDWATYWGNPAIFTNQVQGIYGVIPSTNVFDYQAFYDANASAQGWSGAQTLYNMIYEVAAQVTSWGRYGRITHAFMTPVTNGSLQGLVTTVLNNIVTNITPEQRNTPGIVVDGDLQGMRTRMGVIQFPLDLMISARNIPAQGQPRANGTTPTTTVNPTPPATVTVAASGAAYAGSNWGARSGAFTASSGVYYYAVASTDINMNESNLTWSASVSGITATGAYVVTIAPPAANDAYAFRVYRSGLGGFASGANSPTAVRWIGDVLASGSSNVTFVDANTVFPGGETVFLLDLHEEDQALDYRYLLPLSRIDLFAQSIYMPWAVATIGAPRVRIPKFHGIVKNYLPDSVTWNALGKNA